MKKSYKIMTANVVCFVCLLVAAAPLLILARYNFASADDWSYAADTYRAVQNGEGLLAVLGAAVRVSAENYVSWESRFVNSFFAALQPGIWGEQYYAVVPWIMIGSLIGSEIFLCSVCLNGMGQNNGKYVLPVVCPCLILQILYTPSTVESFYWYTGAVNYTFVFALALVLFALTLCLAAGQKGCKSNPGKTAAICLLAVLVGGDNFATSLSTFLALLFLEIVYWLTDRIKFRKTWFVLLIEGISLIACICGPGNQSRLNGNFGGSTTGDAFGAVWTSLARTFTNILSWTNIKVFLVLLLIAPFVWKAVQNAKYRFRLPGVFTLLSFGVYASQMTATVYVDGTAGGGRQAAILFYFYYVWLLANLIYWAGWLRARRAAQRNTEKSDVFSRFRIFTDRHLLVYCGILGVCLAALMYTQDLKSLSAYKAYRDLRQGWAQQYATEWQERFEVLHDETVTDAVFAPLSVCPETILYTDLQPEDGYVWVNSACASYYDKNSVSVIEEQTKE